MHTLGTLTLTEARHAILRHEFSCVEYAYAMIERHARWRYLNGFTCVDDARLLAEAARCDRDLATSSTPHALLGLPIAIKDNIDTACLPTGNGTLALHNRVPPQHAPVVARLLAQGALIAGKANLHELAFGVSGNNRVTGAVRNPYDFNRIPGGSSSGSGALVGAGVVPAALGTDTGGSVRIPAALCGAVGLRPTVGRYPSGGVASISRTRDTVGPIARSVEDIALLDAILSGTGAHAPMSLPTRGTTRSVRLAVPRTTFWRGLAPDVERVANAAVAKLAQAGFECVDIDLNDYPGFSTMSRPSSRWLSSVRRCTRIWSRTATTCRSTTSSRTWGRREDRPPYHRPRRDRRSGVPHRARPAYAVACRVSAVPRRQRRRRAGVSDHDRHRVPDPGGRRDDA